eukprot:5250732-Amphidinium_carterae.1
MRVRNITAQRKSSRLPRIIKHKTFEVLGCLPSVLHAKPTPRTGILYFALLEDVRVNIWDVSGHPHFVEVRNEFYKEIAIIT